MNKWKKKKTVEENFSEEENRIIKEAKCCKCEERENIVEMDDNTFVCNEHLKDYQKERYERQREKAIKEIQDFKKYTDRERKFIQRFTLFTIFLNFGVICWNSFRMVTGAIPNPILNTITGLSTGILISLEVYIIYLYIKTKRKLKNDEYNKNLDELLEMWGGSWEELDK